MNLRKLNRSMLVAATLIGITGTLSAANASDQRADAEFLSEKISFADLNLNTTQGVTSLYRRISSAAGKVCTPFESRGLGLMSVWRHCMDQAISSAVDKVNNPALTAITQPKIGRASVPVLASAAK
jgi:UrcA family protein